MWISLSLSPYKYIYTNKSRFSSECFSKFPLGGWFLKFQAWVLCWKNPIQLQLIHLRTRDSQPVGSSGYRRDILTSRSTIFSRTVSSIFRTRTPWKMGSLHQTNHWITRFFVLKKHPMLQTYYMHSLPCFWNKKTNHLCTTCLASTTKTQSLTPCHSSWCPAKCFAEQWQASWWCLGSFCVFDFLRINRWSVPVTNEGLKGFPTKNGIILVVTVTGWGVVPK